MTPDAERIHAAARVDIIEALIDATGRERRRLNATDDDLMMFCIYGIASFIHTAKEREELMVTVIDLLSNAVGGTMEAEITYRQSDA